MIGKIQSLKDGNTSDIQSNRPVHPFLIMLGQQINEVEFHKHLGIYCFQMIKIKILTRQGIFKNNLYNIYTTNLAYVDVIWDNCSDYEKQELEKIQIEVA